MEAAHGHMAAVGFSAFSARHVARAVGYSVGTIYNVFPNLDHLLVAVNTRTFELWADYLRKALDHAGGDRIGILIRGYFNFAAEHRNLWMAIYDHRLPAGVPMPEPDQQRRAALTEIVVREIAAVVPAGADAEALARSLIATVHGHCAFALNGTFALMEEPDPFGQALARVRDALKVAGARL